MPTPKHKRKAKTVGYENDGIGGKLEFDNFPTDLIRAFGAFCLLRGVTMKAEVIRLIRERIAHPEREV